MTFMIHFGIIYDFTDSQFHTDISYDNQLATREEALASIPLEEYQHLSKLFEKVFEKVWTT